MRISDWRSDVCSSDLMVAHGLITGALFLITGSVFARGDTYEIDHFGGLASRAPLMTSAIRVGSFASLGLPGLAGFVAEFRIFVGLFAVEPVFADFGLLGDRQRVVSGQRVAVGVNPGRSRRLHKT